MLCAFCAFLWLKEHLLIGGHFELRFNYILGTGANHHAKLARLDHVTHLTIPKPEMFRTKHKLDTPLLTRLQRQALKTLELLDRPGHRCDRVANVKLDHFITRSTPCVFYFSTHRQLSVSIDARRAELQV